ncbi:MAG: hypothetical protein Q4P15_10905 [Propionibacteriaceae bacterium]|nr:hypothetical protein [Propionibacteriaceae bacterium]
MNWMLPLETLPGWPEAPEVSSGHMWLLLLVGPLAMAAVIALLGFTPALGRRFRGELASGTTHEDEHPLLESTTSAPRAAIGPQARRAQPDLDA